MAQDRPGPASIEALRAKFEDRGQGHVFRFWNQLNPDAQERLTKQADSFDLDTLLRGFAATRESTRKVRPKLEPVQVVTTAERGADPTLLAAAGQRGEALLAEGRVGVMVVAGGQATRLGYPGPKGAFPLGPVSDRSLFAIHAQKLRRLRDRCGRAVPWYVMTSQATDAATRSFFAEHGNFELPAEDVFFLVQRMLPSFDFEGKLILETPDHIFENPDGHGGSLTALLDSGALDDMQARGIDTLYYFQVDNPMLRMADPVFLGLHAERNADVSCKVVRKSDPAQKVGVVARVDGRVGVVEYTEIDEQDRNSRDDQGDLLYWTGSIAVHVFRVTFVQSVAQDAEVHLPFHASEKRIPSVDASGDTRTPDEPNGFKLERFVFDALAATDQVLVMETPRVEYSPVKNADGSESPGSSRRDLSAQYRSWLEAAGIAPPASGAAIEIDHSRIDGPEDARSLGIRSVEEGGDVIRIAAGERT